MKEFIVWYSNGTDKFNKEFTLDDLISQLHYDEICDSPLLKDYKVIEICQSVGLKDINNNKIYADCSIVEFGFIGFGESKIVTYQGFAKWNSDKYRYDIEVISHSDRFVFDLGKCIDRISNLKIIDTMQENKLGLINKKG